MNTTTSALLTVGLVAGGKWANDKPLDFRLIIGTTGMVLGLAILSETAPEIAEKLGALVLITACFLYLPAIVKKTGIAAKK